MINKAGSPGSRRATQLGVDISGFPNVAAHFKRTQERPRVKKLLVFEKEVNDGFAKTAQASIKMMKSRGLSARAARAGEK